MFGDNPIHLHFHHTDQLWWTAIKNLSITILHSHFLVVPDFFTSTPPNTQTLIYTLDFVTSSLPQESSSYIVPIQEPFVIISSQEWNIAWVMPFHYFDLVFQWNGGFLGLQAKSFCLNLLYGILRGIWNERNRRLFDEKWRGVAEVVVAIMVCEVVNWLLTSGEFKGMSNFFFLWRDKDNLLKPNTTKTRKNSKT